jgi:hypothetical protein
MYRKEVNERSPMRVFERSIHGGLGPGNVGAIVARPGVGKTALLVQIALDDLMRERKVLHITHEHAVDRVRSFYDEIFHELSISYQLAQPQMVRLEVERNRLIYSHLDQALKAPPSYRGGTSSVGKIEQTVSFTQAIAHFKPQTIIIDGFDFEGANDAVVASLQQLAKNAGAELWLSAKSQHEHIDGPLSQADARGVTPKPLSRFYDALQVIVLLQSDGDLVRLQLLKDHDNRDLTALHLSLDPTTMRVVDDDFPRRPAPPKEPARFHLYSGGAQGAEATFGLCAERWGLQETHFSFEGHPFLARERGLSVLSDEELAKGDFSLVYASHRLKRPLSNIPNIKRILQTVWHQISHADEAFVIGALQEDGTVRGGTGWGAELARLWSKPVALFDQDKGAWFRWDTTRWERDDGPVIQRPNFAGIGTTRLTAEGRVAIEQLFLRTFGAPRS